MKFLSQWFARTGAMLGLLGVAAVIGLLAVVFLSAALCLALTGPLGMPLAALATGGALLVVAALLLLAARLVVRRRRRPPEAAALPSGPAAAAELGEMLGEEGGLLIKQHPGAAILAALLAGFVVGSSPKIRDRLTRIL
jgi:heme A synthase